MKCTFITGINEINVLIDPRIVSLLSCTFVVQNVCRPVYEYKIFSYIHLYAVVSVVNLQCQLIQVEIADNVVMIKGCSWPLKSWLI